MTHEEKANRVIKQLRNKYRSNTKQLYALEDLSPNVYNTRKIEVDLQGYLRLAPTQT